MKLNLAFALLAVFVTSISAAPSPIPAEEMQQAADAQNEDQFIGPLIRIANRLKSPSRQPPPKVLVAPPPPVEKVRLPALPSLATPGGLGISANVDAGKKSDADKDSDGDDDDDDDEGKTAKPPKSLPPPIRPSPTVAKPRPIISGPRHPPLPTRILRRPIKYQAAKSYNDS